MCARRSVSLRSFKFLTVSICGCLSLLLGVPAHASSHKKHHKAEVASQSDPKPSHRHHKHSSEQDASSDSPTSHRKARRHQEALTDTTDRHHHKTKREIREAKLAEAKAEREQALAEPSHHAEIVAEARRERHETPAQHREKLAELQHQHNLRVANEQAHEAKLYAEHLERLARIEAARNQHPDKKSQIVAKAADSGLPIWQGDAYAAQVPVKIVQVDLNDPRIKVSALLARNGIGTSEPFSQMINRAHPNVAVTGTFFSLDNLRPVGDIVVNGSLAYFGGMGTALAITPDNHADMVTVPWGHHHNWSGYDTVVACGPRLLENSAIVLDPRMEHFKDQHMLGPNSRIGVGFTKTNQLVFVMTREPIYLGRLAKIMQSLGCTDAMNLDAGTSTGFYCNGRMLARPGRWLTNAIVVYANSKPRDSEDREAGQMPVPMVTAKLVSMTSNASASSGHRGRVRIATLR